MFDVRISVATPDADLTAAVWPGVTSIVYPGVESAIQLCHADAVVSQLEKLRGIRPGTVELKPVIATPLGVARVREVAASSGRIHTVTTHLDAVLDGDGLAYARAECEFAARSLELTPVEVAEARD